MKPAYRKAIVILAAGAGLFASPAMGQSADGTIVIDGSGVRSASEASVSGGSLPVIPPRGGSPARTSLPFNTPQGAILAGQDTSLAPRQFSKSDRIVLRPPGSQRTAAASPQRTAPVLTKPAAQPAPKAEPVRAEPVRPAAPKPEPKPVARTEPKPAAEAPKAPEKVERPAREVTRPAAPVVAAATPVQQPKPAAPVVREEPKVAAVTPPVASPDVNRLLFQEGAEEVSAEGRAQLEQIAARVRDDRDIRLQVMSYADSASETGDSNRRVSLRRAGNVRRILLDNGIESFRILVRALGAPGPDDNGPGNRVDILIGRR